MGIKWLWLAGTTTDKPSVFFWQLISDKLIGALVPDSLRIYCMGFIFSPIRARVVSVFPIPFPFHVIAFFL
jgi:hypothetical protein